MKTLAFTAPGDEQVFKLLQVPRPTHGDDDVLIKVHAFAINPVRHFLDPRYRFSLVMIRPESAGTSKQTNTDLRLFASFSPRLTQPFVLAAFKLSPYLSLTSLDGMDLVLSKL